MDIKKKYARDVLKSNDFQFTDLSVYLHAKQWNLTQKELEQWVGKWVSGDQEQRDWIEKMFSLMDYYEVLEYLKDNDPDSIIEQLHSGSFW